MSQQINLYQPQFRKPKKPFAARHLPAALAIVAAVVAGLALLAVAQTRDLERRAAEAEARLQMQRKQVAEAAGKPAGETTRKLIEADMARLEGEVQKRQQVLATLSTGDLGNTEGFSDFLAALGRRTVTGVWLVSIALDDAGRSLQMQGRALNAELVPAYLKRLGEEPMMQGRRVSELKLAARSEAPAGKAPATGPQRFVEFSLAAPVAIPTPKGPGK